MLQMGIPAITVFLATLFGVFSAAPAFAVEQFSASVVKVTDGDTINIRRVKGRTEKVRLRGIDCPEINQPFGRKSRQIAFEIVKGQTIIVQPKERDRYGRLVADIILLDGRNLGNELVRNGACWWFRRYAPDDKNLKEAETQAKSERRGLWADSNPIPPWIWRQQRKKK